MAFLSSLLATIINGVGNVGMAAVITTATMAVLYLLLLLYSRSIYTLPTTSLYAFLVISYPFLIMLWFFNAGLSGPISHIMISFLLSVLIIFPKQQHLPLVIINTLVLLGVIGLEYYNPDWVTGYPSRSVQFLDFMLTLSFVAVFMGALIRALLTNYDHEKQSAMQLTAAVIKESEEVNRQNENLQQINQLKDKLFATISHDLRSPINSLKGTLTLLQSGTLSQEEIVKLSSSISERLYHTSNLMENLLSWANTQLKSQNISPQEVNVLQVAKECAQLFEHQIDQKELTLQLNIDDTHFAYADKEMFQSVIRNLLSNSLKFSYPKGIVRIESLQNGKSVTISISDTGKGMSKDQVSKLFGKQHFSTEGTQQEKGVGLGLMLTREFVQRNHGSIQVESQEEQGSTFIITLPTKPYA
ncbi:sensor histidine kinase [Shiella aurantiaca]|uniref:sensor histidine kinase n=1 Tax=Shiella aurantiaca TaxID=3058365 RepID=UPI0029F56B9A|nr:HAMP domain-containing sensor histidine kinase [Shiella aurantiaca]